MEQPFDEAAILRRLRPLAPWARLAFLLSLTERLVPNYVAFSKHHDWGEPEVLQRALDLGWKCLAGQTVERSELEACLARCEEVTPDMDDFQAGHASAGLDAAVCCASVLELLLEDDAQKVADAASLARDTVDMHVQDLESLPLSGPEMEEKIIQHPLMQRELKRQREDLELLEKMERSDSAIAELVRRWRAPAVSSIDLPRV